jgi:malate dehydrogenase (oxaloacetate-decarboxylating)(NADP+)
MCDTKGVIYQGRTEGMNQWKSAHAAVTDRRTLAEALDGADVFLGLSVKGAVTQEMVKKMAPSPIVFAMANPDPEITPEDVKAVRPDALVATGRSDYPNQVNNVLGFPYIFRGALDVRASTINEEMKIAAAEALAALAREDVPDEVSAAYSGRHLSYGPEYLIPAPFDPRLISHVPVAVAKAAMDSGVARRPILDLNAYARQLAGRMNPIAASLQGIFESVRRSPKRVVFAEGEEEKVIRAAQEYRGSGYGQPVLVGREEIIREKGRSLGLSSLDGLEVHNARLSHANQAYTDFLFKRLQRHGYLYRDCQRLVNQDRNVFAACMVALGDADAMVTGTTRSWASSFEEITRVLDPRPNRKAFGLTMLVAQGRTVFIADTNIHEQPDGATLADIAFQTAEAARRMGAAPRVALLSFSSFGGHSSGTAARVREALEILDHRTVDFEYDGELAADAALDYELMRRTYPFCKLTGPANVLIMPDLNSANITAKVLQHLGGGTVIGPILTGLSKSAQIVEMGATVTDIVNLAAIAAHDSGS